MIMITVTLTNFNNKHYLIQQVVVQINLNKLHG